MKKTKMVKYISRIIKEIEKNKKKITIYKNNIPMKKEWHLCIFRIHNGTQFVDVQYREDSMENMKILSGMLRITKTSHTYTKGKKQKR